MPHSSQMQIEFQVPETATSNERNGRLPTVQIARRVIGNIVEGALNYQGEETGEALIGLTQTNDARNPELYVLDTIAPVEGTIRAWAMFEQGDDWQGAIFQWLFENWEEYRTLRRRSYGNVVAGKWDVPLQHLGDWHKQPGMIKPSQGDLQTARRYMRELQLDYLLTPIATLADEISAPIAANTVQASLETHSAAVRIDFWWIRRRGSDFEAIQPVLVEDEDLPRLPPIAWWLANREEFDQEMAKLEAAGLQVLDVAFCNVRGHPPLDTALTIYRPGTRHVLLAITPVNYPFREPGWRIAPIIRPEEGQDFFHSLYNVSSEISSDVLPTWQKGMSLLDGFKAIEEHQGL
ncbi:MAG: hypothetical protein GYB66_05855 [Chloroflexi bacterium]|nr:hypothetical protein [Chloroflexota bacterium]